MIDRWRIYLQSYEFSIEHRPGEKLVIEDGLSRSINFHAINLLDIQEKQSQDPILKIIIENLIQENQINDLSDINYKKALELFKFNKENFIIEDNTLKYLKTHKKSHANLKRIIIPNQLEEDVIKMYHDSQISGHLGIEKTYWKLSKDFWFPDLYTKVDSYVKNCSICEKNRKYY